MTHRLPRSLDELRGLRAARWIRESTAGQTENFGPDEQRHSGDLAIAALGLVDVGVEWLVAHSGFRKDRHGDAAIVATPEWAAMLAAAGEAYDVLVIGYVSRFARDARTLFNVRHELHRRGASILVCERPLVLSSDEDAWDGWAREVVESEAYSRRLGKRIREGYAAKRRRLGIPGGNRAPLGVKRNGRSLELDPAGLALLQRTFDMALTGATDREVGLQLELRPKHVAELLTNPFYAGRLRTGEASALGPLIDPLTWERVQALRARYSRRHRGSVHRRRYGLSGILACAACGRRLTGHTGRYRHVEACAEFKAAAPRRHRRFSTTNLDHRVKGESYRAELYEQAIGRAFEHVAASSRLKADTIALATRPEPASSDVLALARLQRDREQAALRFARDRDLATFEVTLRRLDAETASLEVAIAPTPTAAEARTYLEDLPRLWADTDDDGRRVIAEAVFERIEVLGVTEYSFALTADARVHGWDIAFGDGVVSSTIGTYGRGERALAKPNHLIVRAVPGIATRITLITPPRRLVAVGVPRSA